MTDVLNAPDSDRFNPNTTALLFTDPQIEVLTENGGAWPFVKEAVEANRTLENIERLFKAAKAHSYEVFVSPHYYYPTDHNWHFHEPLGQVMHFNHMFERRSPLSLEGFAGSGADWVPSLRPYIEDGKTIVVSPHKLYGPETNDLVLQLRKRGIQRVILGGMLANMCVEAHARELIEQGFELVIARDATAGPRHPEWGDGNVSAQINFRYLARDVLSTDEILQRLAPAPL
ncbi:cysteine hydrolase [Pseudomonas sp. PDM17]|uniref:cysteine hydrolase n=1 Tax=Pseudomonas sp. PDM17 TaxID=2769285 RepID=UPI00177FF407|nr:cysteine hydrolase [Pseudomonas sp. PDM17]MBD9502744.1 cysteine hydrolase [Pseudomonas sp. PDM17]